jgi:hypothetical protein
MKKKKIKKQKADELRPEYDFSKLKNGVRGKYAARFLTKPNRRRTLSPT